MDDNKVKNNLDTAKIVYMDGKEVEIELPQLHRLFTALRQDEAMTGRKSVVVEVGAWRIVATLLGDVTEPLYQQLLEAKL